MKKFIIALIINFSGMHGNILSMQIGDTFYFEGEQIACFRCKTVEEFNTVFSKNFQDILEDILEVFEKRPESFSDVLGHRKFSSFDSKNELFKKTFLQVYSEAYEKLATIGSYELFVAKNTDNELKVIAFFCIEYGCLYMMLDFVCDIPPLHLHSFLKSLGGVMNAYWPHCNYLSRCVNKSVILSSLLQEFGFSENKESLDEYNQEILYKAFVIIPTPTPAEAEIKPA